MTKPGLPEIVRELQRTNRLLAAAIVQIARTQTSDRAQHMEMLAGFGFRAREIADVLGGSEASVSVMRSRARRKAAADTDPARKP